MWSFGRGNPSDKLIDNNLKHIWKSGTTSVRKNKHYSIISFTLIKFYINIRPFELGIFDIFDLPNIYITFNFEGHSCHISYHNSHWDIVSFITWRDFEHTPPEYLYAMYYLGSEKTNEDQ